MRPTDEFTNDKVSAWYAVLGGLKIPGLLASIYELAKERQYPPSVSDIVAKYEYLHNAQKKAMREKAIAKQQTELQNLFDTQTYCYICRNDGWVSYWRFVKKLHSDYQYFVRCSCPHGRDLKKFSASQINSDSKYYLPNVNETLSAEEIEIITAKNKAKLSGSKQFDSSLDSLYFVREILKSKAL